MDVGDHRSQSELPLEAEPQIEQDGANRQHNANGAVGEQLAGDPRSNDLDTAILNAVAKRPLHALNCGLLGGVAAWLLGDADEHVVRSTKLLELEIAQVEPCDRRPHRRQICRPGLLLHLDQRSTAKVDAEIEAWMEVERNS